MAWLNDSMKNGVALRNVWGVAVIDISISGNTAYCGVACICYNQRQLCHNVSNGIS